MLVIGSSVLQLNFFQRNQLWLFFLWRSSALPSLMSSAPRMFSLPKRPYFPTPLTDFLTKARNDNPILSPFVRIFFAKHAFPWRSHFSKPLNLWLQVFFKPWCTVFHFPLFWIASKQIFIEIEIILGINQLQAIQSLNLSRRINVTNITQIDLMMVH